MRTCTPRASASVMCSTGGSGSLTIVSGLPFASADADNTCSASSDRWYCATPGKPSENKSKLGVIQWGLQRLQRQLTQAVRKTQKKKYMSAGRARSGSSNCEHCRVPGILS